MTMSQRVHWTSSLGVLMLLTVVAADDWTNSTTPSIGCEDARMKCAYRTGCGAALGQYFLSCGSGFRGNDSNCSETCLLALIAVISTDEGKQLMTCTCNQNDSMCMSSKERVEVCRASVLGELNKKEVSCKVATTICNSDVMCYTALKYYHKYCRSMMNGKKCSHRCKNSIGILIRQEKAAKLDTCVCEGGEAYDCQGIHRNRKYLCYGKHRPDEKDEKDMILDPRINEISRVGTDIHATGFSAIAQAHLIFGLTLILYISQD